MAAGWPAISYDAWRETCDTLHAHTQVLGKLAVALAYPEPELQHAALRLTARGRTLLARAKTLAARHESRLIERLGAERHTMLIKALRDF